MTNATKLVERTSGELGTNRQLFRQTGDSQTSYAKDLEQLSRNKITHIISIHESPQPLLQEMTYLRIPLPDTPEANIKKHFKECISFIHYCRLHGGNCLVHCLAGISRSTTIVVAYVMAVTELSWQEVLQAVRAVRPIANPNPGFKQQLEEFGHGPARKEQGTRPRCQDGGLYPGKE
ncbi:dual specificity protein phosphatase 15 isoform X8 [Trachemys scripta elegans]|uniref:dual specificity protein phosphatase 15 isoform X8 n=1 Tax=Trachemys scripta elegans TaxID=31138 RepID=UPI001554428C|nr:dual specificity protein phosphatase 15 isoform X8 [Trachemys scripta elegans]